MTPRLIAGLIACLLIGFSGRADAMDMAPWSRSLSDIAQGVARGEGQAPQPRYVPATVKGEQNGQSVRHDLRPAVAPSQPIVPKPRPQLSAVREKPAPPAAPHRSALATKEGPKPAVDAKAAFCVDCLSNKVILAKNVREPLPIASITKLLTAMIVIDGMKLDQVVEVPADITEVPPHKVGLRPGDLLTVNDLLRGLLMESGNDCAEVLARAYPRGGRRAFIKLMNNRAAELGASTAAMYTPSGLDMKMTLGRKDGRELEATKANVACAKDVAIIARAAFKYPLIREISSTKTHTIVTQNPLPRRYRLASNIKLLYGNLPVAGAKTGFTNMAGRCIVALFEDQGKERIVVVLNSRKHFKAAEKIYRWASKER